MEFQKLKETALQIKALYAEHNKSTGQQKWDLAAYTQGFVGDVGDLAKLVMAKQNLRRIEDVDAKIAHELADCLWSTIAIADELNINLETVFLKTMEELRSRF